MVRIVSLSHNHPKGTATRRSADYGLPSATREDGTESQIELTPKAIYIPDLRVMKNWEGPQVMKRVNLDKLLADTGMFCPWA